MPHSVFETLSKHGKATLYEDRCIFHTLDNGGNSRKKTVFLHGIVSVELIGAELVLGTACGETRFFFDNSADADAFESALVCNVSNAPNGAHRSTERKTLLDEEDFAKALFGSSLDIPQSSETVDNILDRLEFAEADELLAALQGDTAAYTPDELERIEAALVLKMEM